MLCSSRNSCRLLVAAGASVLFLCFLFQWTHTQPSSLVRWKLPKLENPLSSASSSTSSSTNTELLHQTPNPTPYTSDKFPLFLADLLNLVPGFQSLSLPDGLLGIRIEDINAESDRVDHLELSDADFNVSAAAHAEVVTLLPKYQDVIRYKKGSRGIVTIGGGNYQPILLVSIRMLRKSGCSLPIEVFVPEQSDYDPYTCDVVFAALNAKCIVLPTFDNVIIARYQYKSAALLFTSFEDTLFLDADNFPLVDAAQWFKSEPYLSTGMVTWPDFWASTTSALYYHMTNQTVPSLLEHASTEAGSILISRRRHAPTLLLAFYYNLFGPDFYYLLLAQNGVGGEGDKETWVAAARALKAPYYQVRERNHALMSSDADESVLQEVISMVQYDPVEDYELLKVSGTLPTYRDRSDAKIVFLHVNRVKLNPGRVLETMDEFQPEGRKRLWGSREKTIERFGRDVEAEVWTEVIEVACRIGKVLMEVEDKAATCDELRRFWWGILSKEEVEDRVKKAQEMDEVVKEMEEKKNKHDEEIKTRAR